MPVEFRHLAHIDRLQVLSDRSSDVRSVPPVTVEIDPTNICNSNCWWCSTANARRKDPSGLTFAEVSRIVDDANTLGAKSVVFKGGGDPTLKDYLPAAIRLSRSTGLSVGIDTNGVRMSADLLNALVESGAWIRFSIDASNSAMYKKVHRRDDYDTVRRNVSRLVKLRDATASSPLRIGINHTLDQYNSPDAETLLSEAAA